jgi:serine/threonine-protein kinase
VVDVRETLRSALADRYAIDRELGQGGMATVYLAEDRKHHRKVALKVLRPELSAVLGGERFLKEIELTANLQHPHILPLYDSGSVDGLLFYVMPYVEGESLRERLVREKQLGVEEAVQLAVQVAGALDYAHRQGVIHRDIKPENILLEEGQALVADFGIALALRRAGGNRLTETGLSLGTPQYMSPEQASGDRELDARSDIYSLGSVLYELLAGEPPHTGPTVQAVVAKVLTAAVRPIVELRRTVPVHVAAALEVALAKLPADRFGSAHEFAEALTKPGVMAARAAPAALGAAGRPPWRAWLRDRRSQVAVAAVVVVAAAWGAYAWRSKAEPEAGSDEVTRFVLTLADSGVVTPAWETAVSPDGRVVAVSAGPQNERLLVQRLDEFEPTDVRGGGALPFFSPDGLWLGVLRGSEVWRIRLSGDEQVRVGVLGEGYWDVGGIVWHPNGTIYTTGARGLWALPAEGGDARLVIATDSSPGTRLYGPFTILPDGRLWLVSAGPTAVTAAVATTDGARLTPLPGMPFSVALHYAGGLLLFWQNGPKVAPWDLRGMRPRGAAVPLAHQSAPYNNFSRQVAAAGRTIVWRDSSDGNELVWVTRSGAIVPVALPGGNYGWPRLSSDGRRLALQHEDGRIWVHDLRTGTRARLTDDDAGGGEPSWWPDGRRIVTSLLLRNQWGLLQHNVDAIDAQDTLYLGPMQSFPTDVSRDARYVAYYGGEPGGEIDLFVLDLTSRQTRRLALPGAQRGARFSPDGRWLAYESLEGGLSQIVVQPWPSLDARYVVSATHSTEPVWSRNGRELFFRSGQGVWAVSVEEGTSWRAAPPRRLFSGPFIYSWAGDESYDVAPDGRFLMLRATAGRRVRLHVTLNWMSEARRALGLD